MIYQKYMRHSFFKIMMTYVILYIKMLLILGMFAN